WMDGDANDRRSRLSPRGRREKEERGSSSLDPPMKTQQSVPEIRRERRAEYSAWAIARVRQIERRDRS
ncbi:hypothetical protein PENTCL1PPCAC_11774, partial [Pristionchus entomophagus]